MDSSTDSCEVGTMGVHSRSRRQFKLHNGAADASSQLEDHNHADKLGKCIKLGQKSHFEYDRHKQEYSITVEKAKCSRMGKDSAVMVELDSKLTEAGLLDGEIYKLIVENETQKNLPDEDIQGLNRRCAGLHAVCK